MNFKTFYQFIMCGIALVVTKKNKNIINGIIKALKHRGPDSQGIDTFDLKWAPDWSVALGHTRLAIVGLGDIGNQPKCIPDTTGLIFNGEIYGIKPGQDLKGAGVVSDTQWLWENFKQNSVIGPPPEADGIWGIIGFDAITGTISVTRDPLGVIPLFAYEWQDGLIITSEIQSIAKALGPLPINSSELISAVAARQLSYGRYIDGLSCISPGETRCYQIHSNSITCQHSSIIDHLNGYLDEVSDFSEAFDQAVHKQFQADVPLGIQLSGGVDSNLVAATLASHGYRDINTFVARTSLNGPDEADFAIANSRRLGLRPPVEVMINKQSFSDEILTSFGNIDPAFSHPNFFAIKKITRKAHEIGIKVLLCGEGSDELFRGYSRLLPSNIARLFSATLANAILRQIDYRRLNFDQCMPGVAKTLMDQNVHLHYNWVKDPSLRHLFSNYLHELLYRQNIAGMAHSVEVRPPFLDFSVVGYAMRNPLSFLSIDGRTSHFLKGSVKKQLIKVFPEYTGPKRKSGFSMPLQKLISDDVISLLAHAVHFSAAELAIDRRPWLERFMRDELTTFEFERYLWPALVTIGALAAAGHTV